MNGTQIQIGTTEAARSLGISRNTVIAWAKAGKIRGSQADGGYWRFTPADIEEARNRLQFHTVARIADAEVPS